IDERDEPHRNIYGVDWEEVVKFLNSRGYDVVQLGVGKSEDVKGAIRMSTPSPEFLMWAVASSDLFVGIDSGVSHIASGFDVPSVIFFGSVDPHVIHADMTNKAAIHNHHHRVCEKPFCWTDEVGQSGKKCYVNEKKPPCTRFYTMQAIDAINSILSKNYTTIVKEST